MRVSNFLVTLFLISVFLCTCDRAKEEAALDDSLRFTKMPGIDFRNDLTITDQLNPYTYRNFYNGGGVGIGDFDGNGLMDIYFTGNLVPNRLYLNRGNWQFEDVTDRAGVACPDTWSTGVAAVDINADGHQDIYVCKAGPPAGEQIPGMTGVRHNELFINNGDGTFTERSREYGLDIVGLSVHAAFFDYDGDGDLDCYLLNNSTRATTGYDFEEGLRDIPDPRGGNKLLRNLLRETGQYLFEDATREAGIYSSAIGFGLGVTVGDVDGDHWPDLFVSNDFFERDYLYINNQDGTFREVLTDHLPEISKGSMGADLADLTGDGLPELFVTEMLPSNPQRYKTKAAFDSWNRYQLYRDRGYHRQFGRNVLQWNRGNGYFSEIGRLAGVEATDWSWGALLCDLDNDGRRDIFVANGIGKDLLDQDYINFNGNPQAIRRMLFEEGRGITELFDEIPSEPQPNAVFKNLPGLQFRPVAEAWGLADSTFSNGSAYADLDNDGDLDIVVNNVNGRAGIYRNNTDTAGLMLQVRGMHPANPDAIGAKVYYGEQVSEVHPMRGFQSTVDKRIHVHDTADEVLVRWPDGEYETFMIGRQDTAIYVFQQGTGGAIEHGSLASTSPSFFIDTLPATHSESPATDFDRDPLLLLGINNEGPALATADLNGDGRSDLFLGGGAGQAGRILLARSDGTYRSVAQDILGAAAGAENIGAAFFDAEGDGDLDVYVANGSNEFGRASTNLLDELYLNQGGGRRWTKSPQILPNRRRPVASSCVRPRDVDGDGDTDLFIGGRLRPGTYGVPANSYLLLNDGTGTFTAQALPELGMVTDAAWLEAGRLAVAAEWAPLRILTISPGGGIMQTDTVPGTAGLWQSLAVADFNGDGTLDFAAGNHGLNSRLRASEERPVELVVNDFDGNGKAEQIVAYTGEDGRVYPLVLRDDLVKQIPALRKVVPGYADYAGKSLDELFSPERLARSVRHRVTELRSLVVLNKAEGYELAYLPPEAQLAPLYALAAVNLNGDGRADLLGGGNQSVGRPEMGIYGAGFGVVLRNLGGGSFLSVPPEETGLYLTGDVRAIAPAGNGAVFVARSGGTLLRVTAGSVQ